MGRTRKNNDKEEEAKKRHIQSLCDACCIRSLEPWIRASLCYADNSFLEALVPTAQMPHEIGPSSDARIYTEEIIKSCELDRCIGVVTPQSVRLIHVSS